MRISLPVLVSILGLFAIASVTSLAVAGSSDFSISAAQSSLCVNPGLEARTTVTVASVNGYSGTVNTGGSVDPFGPSLSGIPSTVTLQSGQSMVLDVVLKTSLSTPVRVYTVTISGLSGGTFHQSSYQVAVSSDCSVGGTIVQQSNSTMFLPFALGIAAIGAAIPVALLSIYVRGRTGKN